MKHHDRSLITVLIIALFSLASLQALSLALKYNSQSSVLGETVSAVKCCTQQNCGGPCTFQPSGTSCQTGTYQCSSVISNPGPIIPKPSSFGAVPTNALPPQVMNNIPCSVINQLQAQYCAQPPIPSVFPTRVLFPSPTPRIGGIGTTLPVRPTPTPAAP